MAGPLTPAQREAIDGLVLVGESDSRSTLFQLKAAPPGARPAEILNYIERSFLMSSLGVSQIGLSGFIRHRLITVPSWRESTEMPQVPEAGPGALPTWVACAHSDMSNRYLSRGLLREPHSSGIQSPQSWPSRCPRRQTRRPPPVMRSIQSRSQRRSVSGRRPDLQGRCRCRPEL